MHVAAVRANRTAEPVRSFGTLTADLHRLVDCWQNAAFRRSSWVDQVPRSEDFVRQIDAYRVVLDERQQVEAELRRELCEQITRSEDFVRQIATYRSAPAERQQVEAELRNELMQNTRSANLTSRVAE